jgi:glycolate oxidase
MHMIDELIGALGSDRVRHHPLDLLIFAKDAGVQPGHVDAAVFPETTREVSALVRIAAHHRVPIVPRGAGTGLAGGAVPVEPGLIVVTTRLDEIGEVDGMGKCVWVGPGVINLDLSMAVADRGLHFAPDPSSQQACTIGGNVGTNAGGPHCLADGTTVAHVLAADIVTVDGEVVRVGSELPDAPGLDLRAVVVGSEGTLGIVTRVLVKLTDDPPDVATMLLGFPTVREAAATVSDVIGAGIVPAALEMMDRPMVEAVENFVRAGYPLDAGAVLLVEVTGVTPSIAEDVDVISRLASQRGATTVRAATDDAERALLWKGRKSAFGAVAQTAPDYYLHDTVVPRTKLVDVLTTIYAIASDHDLSMLNVFHAGDGNLHPLIAFDSKEPGMLDRVHDAARAMVLASIAAGGSLTGEHGVGSEKRDLMGLVFGPLDLDAQARIREAFDPEGLMNPHKVLPAGSRCFDAAGVRLP